MQGKEAEWRGKQRKEASDSNFFFSSLYQHPGRSISRVLIILVSGIDSSRPLFVQRKEW